MLTLSLIAVACLAIGLFVFFMSRTAIADIVCGFGEIALQKGHVDSALSDFNWAIRIDPKFAIAFSNRGMIRMMKGDYTDAMGDLDEAIRLDPLNSKAFNNRGLLWIYQHEPDKALSDLNESIRLNPRNVMAMGNRGFAWYAKGDLDHALADYDAAIRLDSDLAQNFDFRGMVWKVRGDYERAIADFSRAIRLDPNRPSALNNLAWVEATCPKLQCRNGKKAVEHATRACELSAWENPNRLSTLAAAYAEVGEFPNAVKWEEKAIELNPSGAGQLRSTLELSRPTNLIERRGQDSKGFLVLPSSHNVHF